MVLIKLEGFAQPFEKIGEGLKRGATAAATTGATAFNSSINTGITGVFSLGRGFRDFILRGTVVELAVAVVLGTAFTNLIAAATADIITPLIAAIFQGSNFQELFFELNSSRFKYGDFINAFLTFVFVVMVLYFCVVVPLEKLQYAAFKHKAIMRDCPYCLEEISLAATRCKHCSAEVPLDEHMKRTLQLATAALDAEEQKRQHRWYRRMFASCAKGGSAAADSNKQVLVQQAPDGAQLEPSSQEPQPLGSPALLSPNRQGVNAAMERTGSGQPPSMYASPQPSFTSSAGSIPSCTAINIEQLVQEQVKKQIVHL